MDIRLVGGQPPDGEQALGVVGRICTVPGAKEQAERLGSPEQESVRYIGPVSDALFTGVMVTVAEPDWPAVRTMGNAEGATAERLS